MSQRSVKANGKRLVSPQSVNAAVKSICDVKPGGRCGMVIDEGVLFRTNENAFVQTERRSLDDCDLWCIVSLPAGVFSSGRRVDEAIAALRATLGRER